MGPIDLFLHLFNFVAPALSVALVVTVFARFLVPNRGLAHTYIAQAAINFVACTLVLLVGLVFFGRDGKMVTYAAMVLVSATSHWVMARSWKA
jgi:hypothetical protein